MRLKIVLIAALLFPVIVMAAPEMKGDVNELTAYLLDNRKIVVISGEGNEKAEADNAIVSLVVKTSDDSLKTALVKNRKIRDKIRKQIMASGIEGKDIRFSKFSSTPEYGWFGDKPSSYNVNNEIKITIKLEDQLETIAGIVDNNKEVYFVKTELQHTKKAQSQAKAQDKALAVIESKKNKYQQKLGIKLKAIRVLEANVFEDHPVPAPAPLREKSMALESKFYEPVGGGKSASFGEITYRAFTRVEFVVSN